MKFLSANWKNLIMVNYTIDPKILEPYVPNGTQLDLYNGKCYISLVGFMFENTKVLGLKCPFHINFEEVNLRFYVKHNDKRGVVFIKEIVPKPLITFIANHIYHEHYQTTQMQHEIDEIKHNYTYKWKLDKSWQSITVKTNPEEVELIPDSEAEFIAEHYFGYTKRNEKTYEYEVEHPRWMQRKVNNYNLNIDFEKNYGDAFKILNTLTPTSVFLAVGSKITVGKKQRII